MAAAYLECWLEVSLVRTSNNNNYYSVYQHNVYSSYYLTASQSSRVPNKPPAYTQVFRTASGPLYPSGSSCVAVYSSQQSADSQGTQIIFVVAKTWNTLLCLLSCTSAGDRPIWPRPTYDQLIMVDGSNLKVIQWITSCRTMAMLRLCSQAFKGWCFSEQIWEWVQREGQVCPKGPERLVVSKWWWPQWFSCSTHLGSSCWLYH